jgi:16S rRNA G966 N2-methylase RsmD
MRLTGGLDRGRRLIAPGRSRRARPPRRFARRFSTSWAPAGPVLDLYAGRRAGHRGAVARAPRRVRRARRGRAVGPAPEPARDRVGRSGPTVIGRRDGGAAPAGRADRPVRPFSWVFLDPPYVSETEGLLGGAVRLGPAQQLRRRRSSNTTAATAPRAVGCLFLTDRRQYGDTELSFLPLVWFVSRPVTWPSTRAPSTRSPTATSTSCGGR